MMRTDRIGGSLAAKLLLITAAVSIMLALLISGFEIWREGKASIAAEHEEAQAVVKANIDTLALSVWGVDDRVMEVTAGSLIGGTSIFHVEVIEDVT